MSGPRLQTAVGTNQGAFGPSEWALLAVTASIWGSSFLWIAIGLDDLHPGTVALSRLVVGGLTLWTLPSARQPVGREAWLPIVIIGIVGSAGPALLFAFAEERIESGVAGMIQAATPLVVLAISIVMLKKAPGSTQLLGLAVGFAGSVLLAWPSLAGSDAAPAGVAFAGLALVGYGISSNILPPVVQRYGAPAVVLRSLVVATFVMAPYGLFGLTQSTFTWTAALAMLILGVFGTGLARNFFAQLIARAGAPRASLVSYIVPIVAVSLGIVFREETVSTIELSGLAVVLFAALLISRRQT